MILIKAAKLADIYSICLCDITLTAILLQVLTHFIYVDSYNSLPELTLI